MYREGEPSVASFPNLHHLNLIMKKHQINPNGGTFSKITDQRSSKASRSLKTRLRNYHRWGKTEVLATKRNVGSWNRKKKKNSNGRSSEIQLVCSFIYCTKVEFLVYTNILWLCKMLTQGGMNKVHRTTLNYFYNSSKSKIILKNENIIPPKVKL